MRLRIEDITIAPNRRSVDEAKVAELAESIRKIGLLNPVSVTKDKRLVAGAHRLEAVKLNGETEIETTLVEGDDLHLELAEIDENIVRNELHYLDRAEALSRRKTIYETLHPETRHVSVKGGPGRGHKTTAKSAAVSFSSDTSNKTGVAERTVREEVQLAKTLDPAVKETVKAADLPKADALKLARMPKERQVEIAGKIKSGKAKTVKEAELIDARQKTKRQSKASVQKSPPTVFLGNGIDWLGKQEYCDLLLTDPPYSTDVPNVAEFAQSWLPGALRKIKTTGSAYVFIGAYPNELAAYTSITPPAGIKLEQVLVWTYKNTLGNNPKDRYKQNWQAILYYRGQDAAPLDCPLTAEQWAVMELNAPDGRLGNRFHAWQKPDELAERLIRHSTNPGDTVLDPFCCTGTFLLAAAKLGRIGMGAEIDPANAEIAIERGCVYAE